MPEPTNEELAESLQIEANTIENRHAHDDELNRENAFRRSRRMRLAASRLSALSQAVPGPLVAIDVYTMQEWITWLDKYKEGMEAYHEDRAYAPPCLLPESVKAMADHFRAQLAALAPYHPKETPCPKN